MINATFQFATNNHELFIYSVLLGPSPLMDIDIGEVYECVEKLEQASIWEEY